jgi:hypothetical protein
VPGEGCTLSPRDGMCSMTDVLLLEKCTGLNNLVDPVRLDYDPRSGVAQLAMAVNVDVDNTGRISRRKGYAQLRNDNCHSVWASEDGRDVFFVSGTALYRLGIGLEKIGLRSGLVPDLRMSFCKPAGEEVYYSNGIDCGKIVGNGSFVWMGQAYVGPELIWEVSVNPPVGSLLDSLGGYLLIAQDDVLWYSMPFAYSWYVLSRDRVQFESPVRMLKALSKGVWIGTAEGVWWLGGTEPGKWTRELMADDVAIEGTGVVTDGGLVDKGTPGRVAIWASPAGIFMGNDGGQVVNLTKDSFELWDAPRGSGAVFNGRYICTLE